MVAKNKIERVFDQGGSPLASAASMERQEQRSRRLLVVVLPLIILGVFIVGSALLVTLFAGQQASDAGRLSSVTAVQGGLYQYFVDHNTYPAGEGILLGEGASCDGLPCMVLDKDGFSGELGETAYLAPLPHDTIATSAFIYTQEDDGASYSLQFIIKRGTSVFPKGSYALTPGGFRLVSR